jgi:thioredoxin-related protein
MRTVISLPIAARLVVAVIMLIGTATMTSAAEKDYPPEFIAAVKSGDFVTDYKLALAMAKETKRPILADFTGSDWCGWCIKLKREVFDTEAFKDWASKHAILLEIDFPRSKEQDAALKTQNSDLAKKFQVKGFPTVVVMNDKGAKIGELGYEAGGPSVWIPSAAKAAGIKE